MAEFAVLTWWRELPRSRKWIVGCISALCLAAVLWVFLFQDQVAKMRSLQADLAQLEETISLYRAKLMALPKLKRELQAQRTELVYAKTLLPETNADAENLLSSIEKLGNDVGIEFLLFSPGQEKTHDFYASRTVNLRFQGTFHNLMRFFSHLSGLDRLVTLESVQLRPVSRANRDGVSLQADCQICIYRILSEQEIAHKGKKAS